MIHFSLFPKHLPSAFLVTASLGFFIACSDGPVDGSGDGDGDSGDGDGDGDGDNPVGDGDGDASQSGDPWDDRASGVFVHLFEWPWPDVAEECEKVLGPAGYSAVQVSPASEHAMIAGRPWWERYQPVSYELVSRSGNEAEFADMVARCAAVGVDIYVDAVLNHMSAQANGTGTAGTSYTKYNFPDWTLEDFHSPACEIQGSDYAENATAVRECELLGLADLDTEKENVRQGLANYLIKLVDLGVRGFRIDAAKHMAPEDVDAIVQIVEDSTEVAPYVFLEVIDPGGEAISEQDYAGIDLGEGKTVGTTEFRFLDVGHAFLNGNLTSLSILFPEEGGFMESSRAVVFTDNHDTQRGQTISYRDGVAHELANVFLLGFPYGYPKVMSSFSFSLPGGEADSPPHVGGDSIGPYDSAGSPCVVPSDDAPFDTETLTALDDSLWVCEHRNPALRAMVRFRKVSEGASLAHTWSGSSSTVAYAREGKGFVAINLGSDSMEEVLQTGLAEGSYCNVLEMGDSEGCDAEHRIQVKSDGTASIPVPPRSALVIHVEAR